MPDGRVLVSWTTRRDAHAVAAQLATELVGEHPGPLHHSCPTCGSIEHGRPLFDADLDVSLAHAPAASLVAVSTAGPVGVDLEPEGTADLTWVEGEAIAKAHGVGLVAPVPVHVAARTTLLDVPGHVAVAVVLADAAVTFEVRRAAPEAPDR